MQYNEFKRKIKLLNKEEIEFINKLSLEDVIAFLKTIGEWKHEIWIYGSNNKR